MSASVFLAAMPLAAGSTVRLDGPEGRHAATVMRLRVGETVELVDGSGTRARGVVSATLKDAIDVDLVEVSTEVAPDPRLVVIQAVLKGDHGDLAVDQLTQTGVDRIIPWMSQNAVVAMDRREKIVGRLRQHSIAAGKQARLSRFPEVTDAVPLADVIDWVGSATVALVLHEHANVSISDVPLPDAGTIVLVVGPEGGLSQSERTALVKAGGVEARLGPTVLRGSLAGAVAAGIVLARTRWATVAGSSS